MKINLKTVLSRNPRLITKKIVRELVILDPIAGEIRTLNEQAGFIWQALDKKITVEEIIQKIAKNFEAPEEKIKKETIVFLEEYLKLGLIEIKDK